MQILSFFSSFEIVLYSYFDNDIVLFEMINYWIFELANVLSKSCLVPSYTSILEE